MTPEKALFVMMTALARAFINEPQKIVKAAKEISPVATSSHKKKRGRPKKEKEPVVHGEPHFQMPDLGLDDGFDPAMAFSNLGTVERRPTPPPPATPAPVTYSPGRDNDVDGTQDGVPFLGA